MVLLLLIVQLVISISNTITISTSRDFGSTLIAKIENQINMMTSQSFKFEELVDRVRGIDNF